MGRQIIELVQVLIDRIEKNGYQQRAREDDIADVYKRLAEAEGQAKHWRQARQDAHEAGELMRAEIETLRTELVDSRVANINLQGQLDAARAETVETRKRLNEETGRHRATHAEKIELSQQKEWASKHNADLQQQLDAANAAVTLQHAEIKRLNKFVWKVRWADCYIKTLDALAELDAGTEPAPVAEPLDAEEDTCPGT